MLLLTLISIVVVLLLIKVVMYLFMAVWNRLGKKH